MKTIISPHVDLFIRACGVFGFLHVLVYIFNFNQPIYASTALVALLSMAMLIKPVVGFCVLIVPLLSLDAFLYAPMQSNHTVMTNFFLIAVLVSACASYLKNRSWANAWAGFAPVGRTLLLIMYFFGTFHKINSGFLNPEESCSVTLWRAMPWPLAAADGVLWRYIMMYGTLLIESALLFALLIPRLRYWGILLGISFHAMLALSDYAMYSAFSMLTVALHLLFLSPEAAARVARDPLWLYLTENIQKPLGFLILLCWLSVMFILASLSQYGSAGLIWLIGMMPLIIAIARAGNVDHSPQALSFFWGKPWLVNIISLLFLFNGFTPYLGLKTAQSINMFANLRLEGGASNHLILSQAPGPFQYLEDLVEITQPGSSPFFIYIKNNNLRLVYYDFLNRLEREPNLIVSYRHNGRLYENQSAQTLQIEIKSKLHSRWFRAWFHFRPVDISPVKVCAIDR
ncbi:hypothetical protein [Sinimarinibacterium sp. NLF-5-8]|uniref:hypothetical protein n=1 Tax=Sinimarinibacterium sp. NLF-5-8 TaxID=2698684 RepID=UPI00137BB8FD|nr:hypothetical protein [Sinimarinibacterium sp. NLF-5-8]QHS09917.1 hypothetical protein GT972_06970 [Sinimarinibacterium sp. NLF-5-8]